MYGSWVSRDGTGFTGLTVHTLSQGLSVNGNQMASTRPVSSAKRANVRAPGVPGAANSSVAGMSTWLTQRRCRFAPTRSVTSVMKPRPRQVSRAAHLRLFRWNVRNT
ncbi:hypothetical protein GCM10022267_31120 [Lentzea roselyniae]|uniref:Uncharacterized protein n=1 Tax=Lentzea roselyniae TaxID=531940 RepID=A0ABP7AXK7_9PSEU